MHVYTLLFLILKFSCIYIRAYQLREQLIEMTVPETLKAVIQKEQAYGRLDLYQVVHRKKKLLDVTAAATKDALNVLKEFNVTYRVLEPDLKSLQSHRRSAVQEIMPPGIVNNKITFNRDLHYEEIIQYLDSINGKSTIRRKVSVDTIGKSHQGRDIRLVKIEHPHAKNIVFVDAGIHAREWLSITTSLYLISNLIAANHLSSTNNMNWYIVPLVNPDGYIHSYQSERFHRKNMNFTSCPKECSACGVDLNRNYEYKWGVESENDDLCGETYPGVNAFSEKETQALSAALRKYSKNIILYVALHSYGCELLYPWGYTGKPCDDADDLIEAARVAVDVMNGLKNNHLRCKWNVKNAGIMPGGGGADDYAKGVLQIKYAYTMELQGGDQYGFTYNKTLIKPFVKQSLAGITTLAGYVNYKYDSKRMSRKYFAARLTSGGSIIKTALLLPCSVLFYSIIKAF